ncbi:MAG: hypothetical protein AAGD96_01300 [Chloroflexota bacterium]
MKLNSDQVTNLEQDLLSFLSNVNSDLQKAQSNSTAQPTPQEINFDDLDLIDIAPTLLQPKVGSGMFEKKGDLLESEGLEPTLPLPAVDQVKFKLNGSAEQTNNNVYHSGPILPKVDSDFESKRKTLKSKPVSDQDSLNYSNWIIGFVIIGTLLLLLFLR